MNSSQSSRRRRVRGGLLGCSTALGVVLSPACGAPPTPAVAPALLSTSSLDGTPIAYSVQGPGEPTIVFVHGWACDRTYWRAQMAYFAAHQRVIALDLAGHGSSGRGRQEWTIENFAEDVAAVVRATGAREVVLVGHSLGGPVVVEAARLLPGTVTAVVGVETFFDGWAGTGFSELVADLQGDFVTKSADFVRGMFTPESDSTLVAEVVRSMSAVPPEVGIPSLAALGSWAGSRSASSFAALRVPLGTIQKSGSGHAQVEQARSLQGGIDVEVMSGVGHFLMLEDPDRFNVVLSGLIQRLTAR